VAIARRSFDLTEANEKHPPHRGSRQRGSYPVWGGRNFGSAASDTRRLRFRFRPLRGEGRVIQRPKPEDRRSGTKNPDCLNSPSRVSVLGQRRGSAKEARHLRRASRFREAAAAEAARPQINGIAVCGYAAFHTLTASFLRLQSDLDQAAESLGPVG
jgi:hypothetical protein